MSIERRSTKQKQAIKAVLAQQHGPLLPDEIHRLALRTVPSLGIATVYRSLKSLQEEGLACSVEIPGQAPRYECADRGHHHHFHCHQCHTVFDIEKCVEGIKNLVPPGFEVSHHEITLHGLCKSCA